MIALAISNKIDHNKIPVTPVANFVDNELEFNLLPLMYCTSNTSYKQGITHPSHVSK